jgi:hypothetical protein
MKFRIIPNKPKIFVGNKNYLTNICDKNHKKRAMTILFLRLNFYKLKKSYRFNKI